MFLVMIQRHLHVDDSNILILGLAFKENCPDIRNTKVTDIIDECKDYGANVDVYDPWVDDAEAEHEYGITPIKMPETGKYDAIILAVAHTQFKKMGEKSLREFGKPGAVLYDIKYVLPSDAVDGRL